MKLITVGTGSSGNCYLLQRNNDRFIALDVGCPWKKVMVATKFKPTAIDFALVTHDHSDHNGYVRDFTKNGVEVWDTHSLNPKVAKRIINKGAVVIPFEVPHDAVNYGYLIQVDGHNMVYMTDFGYCRYTFKSWNVDTWLIACNHVVPPDKDEVKYEHVVRGHSSLTTVLDILKANKCDAMKNVILCHASNDADVDEMKSAVQTVVGEAVNVYIAKKGETIDLW